MTDLWLVVMIYASPLVDTPEVVVRVPMPGATVEQCIALGSQIEAMTATPGRPYHTACEYPMAQGRAI